MLTDKNGSTVTGAKTILKMQHNYYYDLYNGNSNVTEQSMNLYCDKYNIMVNRLSDDEKHLISGEFSITDLENTLKDMDNNKSPGMDGLPAEFYKTFWPDIKDYLYASVQAVFDDNCLSITQRRGILTLLPKPNKDLLQLKNWRPLTLMNVDYKIITGTIGNRIKKYISKIISQEQTGFVKGRYIGDNIFKILSIMEYCKLYDKNGMLMLLDFEKAFDMIDWKFIEFALKKFNLPSYLIDWVNIIYNKNNESCIINNGWKSDFFSTSRGVKQGCSLSPYIFIICIEFLTKAIKYHDGIEGLDIGSFKSKILQFADDTCLTLTYNANNIITSLNILKDFEGASGLKLNVNKTEILKIGPISNSDEILCPEFNICWKNNFVRLLGIFLCNNPNDSYKLNFSNKIDTSKTVVNIWMQRNLTIYGKSLVVKTFILSHWIYQITVLPTIGYNLDNQVNSIIFPFLWNNKPDKIKRSVICSNREKGGIRFPNMSYYLESTKLSWIKKIFTSSDLY